MLQVNEKNSINRNIILFSKKSCIYSYDICKGVDNFFSAEDLS